MKPFKFVQVTQFSCNDPHVASQQGCFQYHTGVTGRNWYTPYYTRACQILVKIHFSWKLIMGSEKMDPFYVLNMGNISNFHLDHSNRYLFLLFKFQDPFISPKKNSSDYRVYGSQNNRLEPRVSTQKSVLKNMHRVLRYWQKCKKFLTFCLKS